MSAQQASEQPEPRRPGGQPGNQNARTHGFYANSLTPDEQTQMLDTVELRGLQSEIAPLRVKLLGIVSSPAALR